MNIMALLNALPGSIAQGLIWGVFAIGVYITFKVLDFADMTVDGSIATGGSVAVMMMLSGHNVAVALVAATIVGMLAGMVTGIFHVALGIPGILAGILSQLGLYSVNMRILGKSNQAISVDKYNLILSLRDIHGAIIVSAIFCIVVIALMYGFFGTEMGRAFRATGNNEKMARTGHQYQYNEGSGAYGIQWSGCACRRSVCAVSGQCRRKHGAWCHRYRSGIRYHCGRCIQEI